MKVFGWLVALFGVLAFSIYSYDRVEHGELAKSLKERQLLQVEFLKEKESLQVELREARTKIADMEKQLSSEPESKHKDAEVKEKENAAAKLSS